ncbi:PIN domain-containing protein [Thermus thermophilus]|uniref:PIN domain-containing protein n=1 Tax=Thermus thermophilus TaxID=274 RepID=UPI00226B6097|nr:PIN domain-containing protein [Thermus thermophilus]
MFEAIWEGARRKRYRMATSLYCLLEARENLLRKRPTALRELEDKLKVVTLVPEAEGASWMASLVPEKDLPVLAAAVAAGASVLLTGDNFKSLMSRQDLPLKVLTPRAFVLTFRPGD